MQRLRDLVGGRWGTRLGRVPSGTRVKILLHGVVGAV